MEEDRPTPAEYVDALPSDAPCEVGSKFVENKFDELHCISSLGLVSFQQDTDSQESEENDNNSNTNPPTKNNLKKYCYTQTSKTTRKHLPPFDHFSCQLEPLIGMETVPFQFHPPPIKIV